LLTGTYAYNKRIKYYADYIYKTERLIDMKAKIDKKDRYSYRLIEIYGYPPLAGFKLNKTLNLVVLGRGIFIDTYNRHGKIYVFNGRHKIIECKHTFTEHYLFLSLIRKDLDLNSNDSLVLCVNDNYAHLVAIILINSLKTKLVDIKVYTRI